MIDTPGQYVRGNKIKYNINRFMKSKGYYTWYEPRFYLKNLS